MSEKTTVCRRSSELTHRRDISLSPFGPAEIYSISSIVSEISSFEATTRRSYSLRPLAAVRATIFAVTSRTGRKADHQQPHAAGCK